jgi:hypothetical protein
VSFCSDSAAHWTFCFTAAIYLFFTPPSDPGLHWLQALICFFTYGNQKIFKVKAIVKKKEA